MRFTAVYLCLFASCLASGFSLDDDEEMWSDLMVGRMWHPDNTANFGGQKSNKTMYKNVFENFDSDFVETEKVDVQQNEGNKEGNRANKPVVLENDIQYQEDQEEDEQPASNSSHRNEDHIPVSKQKGSLVFVFDTTHSMSRELAEVKKGAKAIMDALIKQPKAPIHNFIFSPFNDPVVGPLTITTDPKVLEEKMNNVTVYGGGDCPELCLTGLIKALEVCLPNSKVYVFTDAPPKDSHLYKPIVSLVQRKRAEVNFIITKGCIQKNLNELWPYDYIAQTSSGHLFKVKVQDVKAVLRFVKMILQPNEVHLVAVNKMPTNKTQATEIPIVIDGTLSEFTASVSGLKAQVTLKNEKGEIAKGVEQILDLSHLKVLRVEKPNPGIWKLNVSSPYPHMVRVTGISNVTIDHGFSTRETDNMKNTNTRPLKDASSHILIQTTDDNNEYEYDKVSVLDLRGTCMGVLPLKPVGNETTMYRASNFKPPNKFFHLKITGVDKAGKRISRISPTAISPQKPGPPVVTMRKVAVRKEGKPGEITCDIESQVPVTIGWKKNGVQVDNTQTCSEACEAVLHFKSFQLKSQGNYTCHANNTAGSDEKVLSLRVGNSLVVKTKSPVYGVYGGEAKLLCQVTSDLPVRVKWERNDGRPLGNSTVDEDFTLTIRNLKRENQGWYKCIVRNGISMAIARVDLKLPYTSKR